MGDAREIRLDYIPALDGLRAIACLMVMASHSPPVLNAFNIGNRVGMDGVVIFFALSGFLITRILLADHAAGRGWGQFFVRRASRIFPVYYVALLACWWYWHDPNYRWAALYVTNMHPSPTGFGHSWSLSMEEQFYLLWPFVVLFTPRCVSHAAAVAVAILGFAGLVLRDVHPFAWPNYHWWYLAQYSSTLACGSLCAYHADAVRRRGRKVALTAFALATLWYVTDLPSFVVWAWLPIPTAGVLLYRDLLHVVVWPLSVFAFALCVRPWWLEARWLRYLGRISYGVYLFHIPIFMIGDSLQGVSSLAWVPVTWGLTFALAALSYRFFERPIMDALRHRLVTGPAPFLAHEPV